MKMAKTETTREPSPADKLTVREVFYAMCLVERAKPIMTELLWVLLGRDVAKQPVQILPEYCHNIFAVFQRTYFKGLPLFSETVEVLDPAGMAGAATVDNIKKVLRIDWKKLGQLMGIGMRCLRFAKLEAAQELASDGFSEMTPAEIDELLVVIFGRSWVAANLERIKAEPPDELLVEKLNQQLATWMATVAEQGRKLSDLAEEFSPEAMVQFSEGFAEGLTSFLDVDSQLAGESNRSGLYGFLLVVWPEIKAMLESNPKKTLSDLHEWMKPFMRRGLTSYIEIDALRDVCAPPPSGIGLSLRPLKVRSPK